MKEVARELDDTFDPDLDNISGEEDEDLAAPVAPLMRRRRRGDPPNPLKRTPPDAAEAGTKAAAEKGESARAKKVPAVPTNQRTCR